MFTHFFVFCCRWKVDIHCPSYSSREFDANFEEQGYFGISNFKSEHKREDYAASERILGHNFLTSPYRTNVATTACLDTNSSKSKEELGDAKKSDMQDNLNAAIVVGATSSQDCMVNMTRIKLSNNICFNMAKYIEDLKRSKKMNGKKS